MNLICPKCMANATVRVNVDDGDTLTCVDCEEEYTVSEVADLVAEWSKVLPWLLAHPARQPQEAAA